MQIYAKHKNIENVSFKMYGKYSESGYLQATDNFLFTAKPATDIPAKSRDPRVFFIKIGV